MKKTLLIQTILFSIVLIWSGIKPYDQTLWFLETIPVIIGVFILIISYRKFQFTTLTYTFIFIHCCILFIGAHYSYAREPLFEWIKATFELDRNNYDKVGHFAQGFIPALITREIFIRLKIIAQKAWIPFLTVCVCLSISALYELFEWGVAVLIKQSADDFLGMQGYEWDTQSDMLCALIGAACALILLSKIQNKQIEKLYNK